MIALLVRYWSILCHLFTRGSLINYVSDNMLAFGLTDYVARLVARCTVLIVLGYKSFLFTHPPTRELLYYDIFSKDNLLHTWLGHSRPCYQRRSRDVIKVHKQLGSGLSTRSIYGVEIGRCGSYIVKLQIWQCMVLHCMTIAERMTRSCLFRLEIDVLSHFFRYVNLVHSFVWVTYVTYACVVKREFTF